MKQRFDGPRARRLFILFLVFFGALLQADCSLLGRRGGRRQPANVVVQVRNDNWLDVNIYLVRSGEAHRLGTVGSLDERTFQLDASQLIGNEIRLMADPIGSNASYLSPTVMVNPGQTIRFDIKNALNLSTVAVY